MSMHNITRPIQYKLFKELDHDSQKEYIHYLRETYHVTSGAVAQMLGVSASTMARMMHALGIGGLFSQGYRMTDEQVETWKRFLRGEIVQTEQTADEHDADPNGAEEECTAPVVSAPQECAEIVAVHPAAVKAAAARNAMRKFCLTYDSTVNLLDMAAQLEALIGRNSIGRLEISCELC